MENANNGDVASVDQPDSSTNGTTELLFTSAAASVKENNQVCSIFSYIFLFEN